MAALSTAAILAGAGLSAVGAIQQGRSARAQAEFAARQADVQSQVERQQAAREREIAGIQEEEFRRGQRRLLAQRRAAAGASGVDITTGSPLLAQADFEAETELQAQRIRSGGEVAATRLEQQAGLTGRQAGFLRRAGRRAERTGFFRGGASLLTGIGRAF